MDASPKKIHNEVRVQSANREYSIVSVTKLPPLSAVAGACFHESSWYDEENDDSTDEDESPYFDNSWMKMTGVYNGHSEPEIG